MSDISRRGFLKGGLATTAGAVLLSQAEAARAAAQGDAPASAGGMDTVAVGCRINGQARQLSAGADDLALDALRDQLDLTGAKRGCGHGACGACTVLVDGVPQVTCLLPTVALEGAEVTTVEALGGGGLHPVQRAFMAHDALQCGYCTPGFVVEGAAFYERWRAARPGETPSREEVAAAMGGHLCRCGAYASIYTALQEACAGRFEADTAQAARVDARAKVTGQARYTVDIKRPGLLVGKAVRSHDAHGRLRSIDATEALALPGVKAFIRILPDGALISYAGQELAAVAAVDRETAAHALRLVKVEVDRLPPLANPQQALAPGAPAIFGGKKPDQQAVNSSEQLLLAASWEGNLRGPTSANLMARPKKAAPHIEAARAEGGAVVEGVYTSHVQVHTTLEPHVAVAEWDGPERLNVWASTQSCAALAEDLAERYELPHEGVKVSCEFIGAGFGSKAGLQMETRLAVELSREAGAPVRVELDRAEEITVGGLRPGEEIHLTLGAHADGTQAGMISRAYANGGAGVGNSTGFLYRICYPSKYKDISDYDVVTNTPPGKPFRGPGGPQAFFALEQAMDELALARGESPLDLRRRWDVNPTRLKLYDWIEGLPAWKDRAQLTRAGRFRHGVGVASGGWFVFHSVYGQMRLTASPTGFTLASACQDMGNGSKSVVAWEIADVLGISPLDVTVRFGDSQAPRGPLSAGSRTTLTLAPVARQVAEQMRDALVDRAEADLGYEDVRAEAGGIRHAGGSLSWAELLKGLQPVAITGDRERDTGAYFMPLAVGDMHVGDHSTGAVQLSHVVVDTRLGKVKVEEVWIGVGIGRVVVPRLAQSQVEGGVIQGVSYALYEERRVDPNTARTLSVNLEDYRIAGMGDAPRINVHFDDTPFDQHQGGAVGLSELSTLPCAGSIANAVFDATGFRPRATPLRPDAILGGLR